MAEPHSNPLEPAAQKFLLELLDTPGPSGFEEPAARVFAQYAAGFAEVRTDAIGNTFATVNGGMGPRVALIGHIDEIGFIVTKVEKSGLLRFTGVGGWDPAVPVGQRVRVLTQSGARVGAVARQAVHLLKKDRDKVKLTDLWIDIGARSEDDARQIARPGDPVVLEASPHLYENGRLMSRSLDDRVGAFIAAEVARRSVGVAVEVVAIASTAEEISLAGARTSAYSSKPDVACVVDVAPSSDVPGEDRETVELGKGPVITFGAAARSRVGRELVTSAEAMDLEVQLSASGRSTSTDAEGVISAGAGVPTGVLSVPTRNLHTPCEILDLADVHACIELLVRWVSDQAEPGS